MKYNIKEAIRREHSFFVCNGKTINERNWKTLRVLCWVYFAALLLLSAVIVYVLRARERQLFLLVFLAVQLVFCLTVTAVKHAPHGKFTVTFFVLFLDGCIMTMSILLGTVFSTENVAVLFPLFVVTLSEFYILSPRVESVLLFLPFGVFLVMSYVYKPVSVFVQDSVISLLAVGISVIGYIITVTYQMTLFEKQQELEKISSTDPLTGVLNRKAFLTAFHRPAARRQGTASALAFVDINHFKGINDRYGHMAGDAVLVDFCRIAERFFSVGENPDVVFARYGGDEFLILFRNVTDVQMLHHEIERFARELRECSVQQRQVPAYSCSVGVAVFHAGDGDFDRVLGAADKELYRAKEQKETGVSLSVL